MVSVVLMLLATIAALAWAEEPSPLEGSFAPTLRPPQPSFMEDLHLHIRDEMAGRGASPLFRATAASMEVYWRIAAYDTQPLTLTEQQQQQTVDLARMGVTLGLQSTVEDIVSRSPELATVYRCLRTFTSPSIEVYPSRIGSSGGSGEGGAAVRLNATSNARATAALASFDENNRRGRPPPRLRLGSGFTLVELQSAPTTAAARRFSLDGEQSVVKPGMLVMLEADRLGPLSLRSRAALVQPDPRSFSVDWVASARTTLLPQISTMGSIGGDQTAPLRTAASLEWRPTTEIPMQLALVGSQRLLDGEERVMLQYTQQLRWRIPNDIDRWPLGQELDAVGMPPIVLPDRGPPVLVRLLPDLPPSSGGEVAPVAEAAAPTGAVVVSTGGA